MIRKVFGALVGIIILLIAGFFVIGLIYPSITFETKVLVNKPRDVAWKYYVDESKMKEWLTNIKSIERLSGQPDTVGSKFKITFEENGSEIVMTETMTEFRENEVLAFVLENDVIRAEGKVVFIDKGDTTEIVETDTATGGNLFWRSLFVVMKSSFEKKSAENLQRLKANIENIK